MDICPSLNITLAPNLDEKKKIEMDINFIISTM